MDRFQNRLATLGEFGGGGGAGSGVLEIRGIAIQRRQAGEVIDLLRRIRC